MAGMGTIINMIAVIAGGTVGLFLKGGLPERFEKTIMQSLGMSTIFIGIGGAIQGILTISEGGLETSRTMIMIISLALGSLIGEVLNIESGLEKFGEKLQKIVGVSGENKFVEGFVTTALVTCVGAMAIIGSLNDGLKGDPSMLYAKSILDGIIAIIFSSTLGIGVLFAALPLGVYQGAITVSAKYIEPFLSNELITNMSFIGSVLIFGIGINLVFGKKIKVGNMLPAILIPAIYELITSIMM